MAKRLVVGSRLRSSGYGGSDMDDFLDGLGAFIVGIPICLFMLTVVILTSPVFWLAVIAFVLINQ